MPQPTPEPIPQPTPEPIPQPTPEPIPQPTPDPPARAAFDPSFRPLRIDEDYDAVEGPPLHPAGTGVRYPMPPARIPPPPAGAPDEPGADPGTAPRDAVPVWGRRPSAEPPTRDEPPAVLADSPPPRSVLRSGMLSSLSVDEDGLVLRSRLRRTEIPWSEVERIEQRLEGGSGRLVAVTHGGPRELPATSRTLVDLRDLAALLEAYRQRAAAHHF
jgi:hypothetical protein